MAKKFFNNITTYYTALAIGIASFARGAKAADAPASAEPKAPSAVNASADTDALLYKELITFEGYAPVSYKDGHYVDPNTHEVSVGHSIYYGHQLRPGEILNLTQEQAKDLLRDDIAKNKQIVKRWAANPLFQKHPTHHVTLNQHQLDGLAALVFNIGPKPIYSGTLGKKLIAGDYEGAAAEFLKWDKILNEKTKEYEVNPRQKLRRETDEAMFVGDDAKVKTKIGEVAKINQPIHHHKKKSSPSK